MRPIAMALRASKRIDFFRKWETDAPKAVMTVEARLVDTAVCMSFS